VESACTWPDLLAPGKPKAQNDLKLTSSGKASTLRRKRLTEQSIDRVGCIAEPAWRFPCTSSPSMDVKQPAITAPIVGATKPTHLFDAVAALSLSLTPEEIASLEETYAPHPVSGIK